MRPLTYLDGGEIFVSIFQFASNVPNFFGFRSNLSLVDFFQSHPMSQIPHETQGNVLHNKKTLLCT